MPYVPGQNWVICDLSGKKVLMRDTKKTWDGLRVCKDWWDPKHPQLSVRGIPDRQAVRDGRPRPADIYTAADYGCGDWTLQSPNDTIYTVSISDAGALESLTGPYQPYVQPVYLGGYLISIANDTTISAASSSISGPGTWIMVSPAGTMYEITVVAGTITIAAA